MHWLPFYGKEPHEVSSRVESGQFPTAVSHRAQRNTWGATVPGFFCHSVLFHRTRTLINELKAIALTTLPAIRLRKPIKGGQGSLRTTHRAAAISETAQHLLCTPTTAHNPQASTNIVLPEKVQCRDCEAQQEAGGIEEHTVSPLPTARGPHAPKVWILAVLPSSAVLAALLARSASRKSCPNASWMHRTARARRFPRSKDIRHA